MTAVFLTIDTEYSAGLHRRLGEGGRAENFARSIAGETPAGAVGIGHQMDVMEAHGLKGVFFVDPMPALVWGVGAVAAVVEPIVRRGHEVQLHCHPEWLEFAGEANPLPGRTGRNLRDFSEDEQEHLLRLAQGWLVEAGAPPPTAFRAGNYGADDATLRALARIGIAYDSSHVPGIAGSDCGIGLGPGDQRVTLREGVLEVPVGTVPSFGALRHAQITALSHAEMAAALRHAAAQAVPLFVLVGHSFELLSRDRTRPNAIVARRFRRLCETIAATPGAASGTFATHPPRAGEETGVAAMPPSALRSAARMAEQALANALYGSD